MEEKQDVRGGRVRWPTYTLRERVILKAKFLGDWQNLRFLKNFWNPICDDRDLLQFRRAAEVWRLRLSRKSFKSISVEARIDQRKACALVSGKNLRPYLVQAYLNSEALSKPREGWKWILECTPKPTCTYPKAILAPSTIQSYHDLLEFLSQFPPIRQDHPALKFFGLFSDWVELHKTELFGFLLGFLVGDAGKDYAEYEYRSRHYYKSSIKTTMSIKASNLRILTYVQLALQTVGISSERHHSNQTIRWNSRASNLLTWAVRVCLGLRIGERTSRNPIRMDWLLTCPRGFLIAFLQGLAESDGSVDPYGYYAAIASVPNVKFYHSIFSTLGTPSRMYPKNKPTQLRINLVNAFRLPLFNPVIESYRFQALLTHAIRRKLPPLPTISQ